MRERARQRIDQETESEREARLADMSTRAQQRIDQETDESEREARLVDMSTRARKRIHQETESEKEADHTNNFFPVCNLTIKVLVFLATLLNGG